MIGASVNGMTEWCVSVTVSGVGKCVTVSHV